MKAMTKRIHRIVASLGADDRRRAHAARGDRPADTTLNTDLSLAAQQRAPLDSLTRRNARRASSQRRASATVHAHVGGVGDVSHASPAHDGQSSSGSSSGRPRPDHRAAERSRSTRSVTRRSARRAGAVIGAMTSKNKVKGGLIGAAVGGILGGVIGNNVDKKKKP